MKRIFPYLLFVLIASSCSFGKKIDIGGVVEGLQEGSVVLKILQINVQNVVDTVAVSGGGNFTYTIQNPSPTPEFYYLYHNDRKIASLLLSAGDRVRIATDTLGENTVVEGSPESNLLMALEKSSADIRREYDNLIVSLANADTEQDSTTINYALGALYVKQKQEAIRSIFSNPSSMTNIMLLYQRFPGDIPVFADYTDRFIFQRIYDSLKILYPNSPYLYRLRDEIAYREQAEALNEKLTTVSEISFPELSLPDTNSERQSLRALEGKVILLSFWTITDVNQKTINLDFKDLYEKYHLRGFEIYQVSVDVDKTAWATVIKEQELPWINVCDGLGSNSVALVTYNVTTVPTNFIIDKSGMIVGRDLFDDALEAKIRSLL